eukprot:511044_1
MTANLLSKFKFLIGILMLLVLMMILLSNKMNLTISNINVRNTANYNNKTLIDGIAIISTGKAAKTDMADKLVNSLFESSLSTSIQIYLLTDHISCYNASFYSQFLNLHIIQIPDTANKRYNAMLQKTQFFSYLPDDAKNILYLDVDIKANKNFNEYIIPTINDDQYKGKNCSLIIQRERQFVRNGFNSGTFVVNRYKSEKCIHAWNHNMVFANGKYKTDQDALNDTKECADNICFLPDDIIIFSKHLLNLLPAFISYRNAHTIPLVHYTAITHGTDESITKKCKEKSITDIWGNNFFCTIWKSGLYPSLFLHAKSKNFC